MGRLAQVFERLGDMDRPYPSEPNAWMTSTGALLPPDVLSEIAALLSAQDLAALGSTCRTLHQLAASTYPGIKLQLYPHQKASLAFIMRAEASRQRGGILADEPGTGKTITILALLCKTAGLWTARPPSLAQLRLDAANEQWLTLTPPFKRELGTHCPRATPYSALALTHVQEQFSMDSEACARCAHMAHT